MGADGENARSSNCIELDIAYPHFEYPQFKQVAHPSMITTALVLHLWHMLADGGKVAPSPVTAMSSAGSSMLSGRAPSPQPSPVETGEGVTSAFFFERCSYAWRFSAIRYVRGGLSSGSWVMPMDFSGSSL